MYAAQVRECDNILLHFLFTIICMFGKLTNVSMRLWLHMGWGIIFRKNDNTLGLGFPQLVGNSPTEHQGIPLSEEWRAILTPKNENVDKINEVIMDKFPGIGRTYLSADSVAEDDLQNAYPTEFLN